MTLKEVREEARKTERRRIGKILKMNSMEEVLAGNEIAGQVSNPLWNVRIYDDEIKALLKGQWPEDWQS